MNRTTQEARKRQSVVKLGSPAENSLKKVKKGLAFFSALSYNNTVVADVAQQVERILGKDEVTGSNPVISSRNPSEMKDFLLFRSHFCKFWSADLHFPVSKHLLVSF